MMTTTLTSPRLNQLQALKAQLIDCIDNEGMKYLKTMLWQVEKEINDEYDNLKAATA